MKRNWQTHYNVFVANILLALLLAINIVIKQVVLIDRYLTDNPTDFRNIHQAAILLVAPVLAAIFGGLLYWLNIRAFFADYPYQKFHYNKQWTRYYLAGIGVFCGLQLLQIVFAVTAVTLFNAQYNAAMSEAINQSSTPNTSAPYDDIVRSAQTMGALLWSAFGISLVGALISCGLIKYAIFRIDLELMQRRAAKEDQTIKTPDADTRPVNVDLGKQTPASALPPKADDSSADQPPIASAGL